MASSLAARQKNTQQASNPPHGHHFHFPHLKLLLSSASLSSVPLCLPPCCSLLFVRLCPPHPPLRMVALARARFPPFPLSLGSACPPSFLLCLYHQTMTASSRAARSGGRGCERTNHDGLESAGFPSLPPHPPEGDGRRRRSTSPLKLRPRSIIITTHVLSENVRLKETSVCFKVVTDKRAEPHQ
jgi:hypothetical protein